MAALALKSRGTPPKRTAQGAGVARQRPGDRERIRPFLGKKYEENSGKGGGNEEKEGVDEANEEV